MIVTCFEFGEDRRKGMTARSQLFLVRGVIRHEDDVYWISGYAICMGNASHDAP